MAFWLRWEDLVVCWVGPFASTADAEAHAAFCRGRGDAAETRVVEIETPGDPGDTDPFVMSPERDREWETSID